MKWYDSLQEVLLLSEEISKDTLEYRAIIGLSDNFWRFAMENNRIKQGLQFFRSAAAHCNTVRE